ncbi:MAG: SiaB family protein kinase [Bacteroidales bacterium]|nr:SiaB family protein kinase [Bacteroidales bacterium]
MGTIDDKLDFGFELFQGMQKDNLNYIYRGLFTQTITDNIIALTEINLDKSKESSKIKKRVFSIMVEGLQNITRHQEEHLINELNSSGIFVIQQKNNKYFVTTGNLIVKNNIEPLTKQLHKINSLEKDELKQYYKEVLNDNIISSKGGAGLGLIEMARKSGNKLAFDFREVNDEYSYFYLHTEISYCQDKNTDNVQDDSSLYSIDNIKQLHKILNDKNVLLIFNGIFNQDSLISLLSIIEGHMIGTVSLKKRVFNIMVEMLQNIVKHADNSVDGEGNPGIFFIIEQEDKYFLNTGNYIRNNKVELLEERINYVNNLTFNELNDFYNKSLFNFEIDSSKESGLGLIELRLKSKGELNYNIYKIDEESSFFTLQTGVQ